METSILEGLYRGLYVIMEKKIETTFRVLVTRIEMGYSHSSLM